MNDDVAITIGGQAWSGWQSIRVTRGAERVPSSFSLAATEKFPGQIKEVAIAPFSPCQITIGRDLVLTGYVDRVMPAVSGENHTIQIQGRSKIEDIVDCSVTPEAISNMQVRASTLVQLATQICQPFGIKVKSLTGSDIPMVVAGMQVPPFNVVFGETGYEVIERVARYLQTLVYDDVDGTLLLANVGQTGMASGFVQGINVQEASGALSGDQRYSDYLPSILSYQTFSNPGSGLLPFPPVKDPGVPRYRPLFVVSEVIWVGQAFAQTRAQWEKARRYGRSQAMRVVCDSWRDSLGELWQPNAYAPIYIPSLKCTPNEEWVIGEVTFARDSHTGTTAELTLMPREAFMPQPIIVAPFGWYNPSSAPSGSGSAP